MKPVNSPRLVAVLPFLVVAACHHSSPPAPSPITGVPTTGTITDPSLSAPVDVVRDEHGIPHIYAANLDDGAFVEGYMMAQDRWVQMELARNLASGTLAALLGSLQSTLIDSDIQMRMHHHRKTAGDAFAVLQASSDPKDKVLVSTLSRFAAGANAYLTALQNGKYTLPPDIALIYDPTTAAPWTEVDTLVVGRLLTFEQSYTADGDIMRSSIDAAAAAQFDQSTDPAKVLRKGIGADFQLLAPVDLTYTLPSGWTTSLTCNEPKRSEAGELALYQAARRTVEGVGLDRVTAPARGSNNWIVGPQLTKNGHTIVANDPHLSLMNPATFWMVHLVARGGPQPVNAMGLAIPGVPGIALGFNEHVAWGATDSYLDATDVYRETVVPCTNAPAGSPPCVVFQDRQVPLVPREEKFDIGSLGNVSSSMTVTYYDVPHHGPIIPRITSSHGVEPLGSTELSVRFTGYEVTQEVRGLFGLITSSNMQEAVAALEKDFTVGGFNWVVGDDQGHFGWTETNRVPRRPAGAIPWKVMPGDGSAEWGADLDLKYVPHAFNPSVGFLATANNDPIGVTDKNDPLADAPMVDGAPLYVGADFDPGTRVGRITKRLQAASADHKLTLDDMQSIQADAVTEWGQLLTPTLLDAAHALAEEIAQPGTHPELTAMVAAAPAGTKALVQPSIDALSAWSFDTPSGADEDQPTPAQLVDSRATLIYNAWLGRFLRGALWDELGALGVGVDTTALTKLLVRMCTHPDGLATGRSPNGDSILFDDLKTAAVETKLQISAKAVLDALGDLSMRLGSDPAGWRWGKVHTLMLFGELPLPGLQVPLANDPKYGAGWPRHGDNGTVDVADHGISLSDYTYGDGPQQRLVVELTPQGPVARNVLPGGEVFDPQSPHYRDLIELWRKNQTFDVPFDEASVAASAKQENSANHIGRVQFVAK